MRKVCVMTAEKFYHILKYIFIPEVHRADLLKITKTILEKVEQQNEDLRKMMDTKLCLPDNSWEKNKIRQFNSIRKYLNPTMIALLRMEMFANDQRYEYRNDEKKLSKELLALNPTVYDYIRNEWSLSLPPKEEVENWNHEEENDLEIL